MLVGEQHQKIIYLYYICEFLMLFCKHSTILLCVRNILIVNEKKESLDSKHKTETFIRIRSFSSIVRIFNSTGENGSLTAEKRSKSFSTKIEWDH